MLIIQSSLSQFPTVKYSEAEAVVADQLLSLHLKNKKAKVEKGRLIFANAVTVSTAIAFKIPLSLIVSVPVTLGVGILEASKKVEYDLQKKKINKLVFEYVKVFSEENKENDTKKIDVINLAQEVINLTEGNFGV